MTVTLFAVVLVVATVGIGLLCWSWMQSTRASQRKTEEQNQRVISLLERQNDLLEQLVKKRV